MNKRRFMLLIRVALGIGILSLAVTPAQGDPSRAPEAEGSTLQAQINAASRYASQPNVTCAPEAYGRDVNQRTNIVVGEIYGQEMYFGRMTCVSLTKKTYSITIGVNVEYMYAPNLWKEVTNCTRKYSGTVYATQGVAQALAPPAQNQPALCSHSSASTFLGFYHRAHVWGFTSLTGTFKYENYSPVWYMFK